MSARYRRPPRRIPGPWICGACGAEHQRDTAYESLDEIMSCGHPRSAINAMRTLEIPRGNGKRRDRRIRVGRRIEGNTLRIGFLAPGDGRAVTLTAHLLRLGPRFQERDLWLELRDAWRDAVLPADWRERRHARKERQHRARVEFCQSWQSFRVSYERCLDALRAAAHDPHLARLWLELSGYLGRDATWAELKAQAGLTAGRSRRSR